ncbi:MAG: glycosyltransferase family 2 protein [Beijerinckiaceae bacterium]
MNLVQASQDRFGAASAPSADLFELPLVSVIVINYNFCHLLPQAVESVFSQTYPRVECIIVDSASTDESPAVLRALEDAHSGLKIIQRTVNEGQTAATLDGFRVSSGQYVIFLDGDDALLPQCIETHIFVHLSLRIHVGFTAGDMLQVVQEQVVTTTGEAMNGYIRSGRGLRANLFRPFHGGPDGSWPPSHFGGDLRDKVHYVPPLCTRWVWSPTSGLCYRRDALALFADNEQLPHLRTCTDMYFAHGIGGWCGSVLIDEPLFVYRIHGSNSLTLRAQLNRSLSYQPGTSGDSNDKAIAMLVDQFVSRSGRFGQNLLFKLNLIALIIRLNGKETDMDLPRWAKRSSVANRLVVHFDSFAATFGRFTTKVLMFLFGVPWPLIRRAGHDKAGTAPDA